MASYSINGQKVSGSEYRALAENLRVSGPRLPESLKDGDASEDDIVQILAAVDGKADAYTPSDLLSFHRKYGTPAVRSLNEQLRRYNLDAYIELESLPIPKDELAGGEAASHPFVCADFANIIKEIAPQGEWTLPYDQYVNVTPELYDRLEDSEEAQKRLTGKLEKKFQGFKFTIARFLPKDEERPWPGITIKADEKPVPRQIASTRSQIIQRILNVKKTVNAKFNAAIEVTPDLYDELEDHNPRYRLAKQLREKFPGLEFKVDQAPGKNFTPMVFISAYRMEDDVYQPPVLP